MWRLFVFLIVFSFVRSSAGSQLLVPVDWSRGSHRYSRGGTLLQLHPWPLLPTGAWSVVPIQWRWSEAFWSCSDRFGVFWGRNDGQFNNRLSRSVRKHPTFCHATTCFQGKRRLRNEHRSSMLMTCHYLDLGRASDCLKQIFLTSSVWNLCSRSSDLISRGNQWWGRGMTAAFSGYLSWVCKLNNLSFPHLRAV